MHSSTSKACFRCGANKPLSEFYAHANMADGHLNKCKDCTRKDVRANRLAKLDKYREYDIARAKLPHRKAAQADVTRSWRAGDRRRSRAHSAVARAVRRGALVPQPCERCGRADNIHAHHDNYDNPLDVKWLCPVDHNKRHQELEAAGIEP